MALSFLRAYLAPQRARIALLAGLMLAVLALQLSLPRLVQRFIDQAAAGAPLQTLITLGFAYLAVALSNNAVWVAWRYVAQNVGLTATNQIRSDLALHCLKLDMGFHSSHTPGEMIERIDGDVSRLSNFLSSFVAQLALNGMFVIGVIALLFAIDWRAALPMALCSALAALLVRRLSPRLSALSAREQQASAGLMGFLEERLSGTEDIRANGATGHVLARHADHGRTLVNVGFKQALAGIISWRLLYTLLGLGSLLALVSGALRYLDHSLSLGNVYVIFAYTQLLNGPLATILREFNDLQQAIASIGRVRALFALTPAVTAPALPVSLPAGALSIDFDHVTFAYPGDDTVLSDISLTLPAGGTLGVIGRTGSGKTTLSRLLLRLYDPVAGTVRIGGVDARAIDNRELRARVAIVTQDVQIFSASVRDNITLFDPAITDARVQAALEVVGLGDWARALPLGIESKLAAGGTGLSAGEAQLLAFARTFLRDPGVVVLDEASSRLDPASERALDLAVDTLLSGRSGMLIAHRLSTLRRVDQIAILEDGRLVEHGARAALAADPGSRFAQLLAGGIEQVLV